MPYPKPRGGDEDGGKVISGGLLVARGDLSEVLEPVEEPLNQVALAVEGGIDRPFDLAVALREDMAAPAARVDHLEESASILAPDCGNVARREAGSQEVHDRRLVRGLPWRQGDRQWQAAMVDHRVDLGAQPATRTAKGVIRPHS